MKFVLYLENKIFYILFQATTIVFLLLILSMAGIPFFYIFLIILILIGLLFLYLVVDFMIQKKKYLQVIRLVDQLDEKYYISEMIPKSSNLENQAYIYALKKACKAMNDKISSLEQESLDYREYTLSFVHEIKTPLCALSMLFDYHKNKTVRKELDKIDSCVEQMLYYARSGNPEKDYFIKEFVFSDLLHRVLLDYKPYLLEEGVHILVYDADTTVFSDEKWLHFILSQIVQNSLKYFDKKEKTLEFFCESKEHSVLVHIKDNGCGIQASDLPRVFEKGFTGSLRQKKHSTGMGLYLARELCLKLGLSIEIFSKEGEYTEVIITLPLNTHEFKRGS